MPDSLKMLFSRANVLMVLVTLFALLMVGKYSSDSMEREFREQSHTILQSLTRSAQYAVVDVWFNDASLDFRDKLKNRTVIDSVKGLLELPVEQKRLVNSPAQKKLRAFFSEFIRDRRAQGFFIINREGYSLGSMRDTNVGTKNLIQINNPELFEKVFSTGKPQLVLPVRSDVPLPNQQNRMVENYPTMFVLIPLQDKTGKVIAACTLRFDPYKSISRIVRKQAYGKTGETYLVNRQGQLITQSRFESELWLNNQLSSEQGSILNLSSKDPGVNLLTSQKHVQDQSGTELTYAARQLLSEGEGYSLESYRNYLGVRVMGNWLWDDRLNIGIIAEISEQEALASFYRMRNLLILAVLAIIVLVSVFYLIFIRYRAKANREIAESEDFLSNVMDNALVGIVTADENGIISSFNRMAVLLFGYEPQEVLGKSLEMLMPERFRAGHGEKMRSYAAISSGNPTLRRREFIGLKKSSEEFPVEIGFSQIYIGGERVFTAIIKDLTQEKKSAEALFRSEANLAEAQSIAHLGSWEWLLSDDVMHWSDEMFHIYDLDVEPDRSMLEVFVNAIHPEDDGQVMTALDKLKNEEKSLRLEYRIVRPDGSIRWVHATAILRFDHASRPTHIVGTLQDISERKEYERQLDENRQRLELAQRMAHLGSWEYIINTGEVYCSAELCRLWGLEGEQRVYPIDDLMRVIHPDDIETVSNAIDNAIKTEKSYLIEYRIRTSAGLERYIEAQGGMLYDDNQYLIGLTGVVMDVTQRREYEERLKREREAAEAASRSKSEFLAMMSHEIRTPLNAVIGMSELALMTELSQKQRNYIQKSHDSAQSLLSIINDVLDFSKIESGHVELENISFNINDVLDRLTHIVGMKAQESGLEFIFDISTDIPQILIGDPTRLSQILINLGSNAVKFTRTGEIILRMRLLEDRGETVKLQFDVIDTGIGIEKDKQDVLFDEFVQADSSVTREFGGTGLGLTICKRLVEMMGGEIWLESELGAGSTFSFTLIAGRGKAQLLEQLALPRGLENMRAMIVDDNETARYILNDILTGFGFRTTLISNGQDAVRELERAQSNNQPFGLVLMDWKMPEYDGLQAAQAIFADDKLAKSPVILMVTAYSASELAEQADKLPLSGVLVKPVNPSIMLDMILRSLGQKGFLPDGYLPVLNSGTREAMESLQGINVLLVEDNDINQELALELLNEAGAYTEVAGNGREALVWLEQKEFDLVLMDVHMPIMDGFTTTRKIRSQKRFKDLPIIATTANAMAGDRQRCLDAGMTDYLSKPLNIHKMMVAMVRAITQQDIKFEDPARYQLPASMEHQDALPEIANLDTRAGLFVCNNNVELYRRLLQKYLNNENFPALFRQAIEEDDWELAIRLAHTLKGNSGNIGAEQLQIYLKEVQHACEDEQSRETLLSSLDEIEPELKRLIEGIKEFLKKDESLSHEHAQLETLAADEIIALLQDLLRDNNTEATDYVEHLQAAMHDQDIEQELGRLSKAVGNYDFDAALELLADITTKYERKSKTANSGH